MPTERRYWEAIASKTSLAPAAGARASARSELASEGFVLLRYILGREPDEEMVDLYERAIATTSPPPAPLPAPLRLPLFAGVFPPLLRLFDPIKRRGPFKDRVLVACLIADTGFAPLFYDYQGSGFVRSSARLAAMLAFEGLILPFRLVCGALWRW